MAQDILDRHAPGTSLDTRALNRALPVLAKDKAAVVEIEEAVQRLPTEHQLRLGDARSLDAIEDESVHLIVTSPPYWTLKEYGEAKGQLGAIEDYEEFVLVNGHAENKKKTANTNFALLVHIELTDPVEDTTEYGRAIAKLATTIGGGRPILQRLKDLEQGRRSTQERIRRVPISPTLGEYTPGDISMALPQRVVTDILEGIERLDRIMPGLAADGTLIYAPEIKFYDTRYRVRAGMETELPGFYVAGDASGHSRGIVFAAVTGILAARHIKSVTRNG